MIFKTIENKRRPNFDRRLRGCFQRGVFLMRRIERARAAGWAFPMRIFLVAERYSRGFLRERCLIAEYVETGNAPVPREAIAAAVRRAHSFGICWSGDPNGGNIVADGNGALRGLDLSFKPALWRERAKDLNFLIEAGILPAEPLPFCVRVVRAQSAAKNFLRKIFRRRN